jgi:putative integral membrane protein (TIGR02587 family)
MADRSNNRRGKQAQGVNHNFAADLAHDFGGAIIFSIPLLMTMEMWWLGFYMDRFRLALFLALAFLMVMGLSYFEGGEETFKIEVLDALAACAVGHIVAADMLLLFGIIKPGMSADELIGKIALLAVPCSIGAILARRQLDVEKTNKEHRRHELYGGKIFLMSAGAIFLAFQLAPTEEMILIGYQITGWHAIALAVVSLGIMQAFLCSIEAKGSKSIFSVGFFWSVFLRFTIVGYALVLLLSFYVLWTFGRLDGVALSEAVVSVLILGFPAALGASAARLIL